MTGWLTETHDTPIEGGVNWGPQEAMRTMSQNGFGEVVQYTYGGPDQQGIRQDLQRSWNHDGVGNWECSSGDFPEEEDPCGAGGHTRCYNRRQEIGDITMSPCPDPPPAGDAVEYDEAGRVVSTNHPEHGTGALSLAYDGWGRLRSVTQNDVTTVTYTRDALGRLIRREGTGEPDKDYYYGAGRYPLCSDAGGGSLRHYVRSPASGRLQALSGFLPECSWYVVDGRGEIMGLISVEVTGTAYRFYWYSSTGAVEGQDWSGYAEQSDVYGEGGVIWEEIFLIKVEADTDGFIIDPISDAPPPAPEGSTKKIKIRYLENVVDWGRLAPTSFLAAAQGPKRATQKGITRKAEKKYGKIPIGFIVHHIDKNKNNNRPDNLMILHRKDHYRVHNKKDIKISKN